MKNNFRKGMEKLRDSHLERRAAAHLEPREIAEPFSNITRTYFPPNIDLIPYDPRKEERHKLYEPSIEDIPIRDEQYKSGLDNYRGNGKYQL